MPDSVGISLGGNAAPPPPEMVGAVVALAKAIKANARAIQANAEATAQIVKRLEGTPAVYGATISGCSINMASPAAPESPKPTRSKTAPKKRARRSNG